MGSSIDSYSRPYDNVRSNVLPVINSYCCLYYHESSLLKPNSLIATINSIIVIPRTCYHCADFCNSLSTDVLPQSISEMSLFLPPL